jgi:CRISPR-associated protein Cas2
MSDSEYRYIICYDISNDKRRRRLVRCLHFFGERVQESVFEAVLNASLMNKMQSTIAGIINHESDCVYIYPVTGINDSLIKRMGKSIYAIPTKEEYYII